MNKRIGMHRDDITYLATTSNLADSISKDSTEVRYLVCFPLSLSYFTFCFCLCLLHALSLQVISILTSSRELIDLIKNVDIMFHSKPTGSSKSMLSSLYRFVPTIREQLQVISSSLFGGKSNQLY